jgi:hypothetical protein
MELIPNWQDQDLTCAFCGSKKSVKYRIPVVIIDTLPTEEQTSKVYACNKCALLFSARGK